MNSSSIKLKITECRKTEDKSFDNDLVRRCQDGNTDAMESVYNTYKQSFLNLAYRFTGDRFLAEDLLQDIFIKIFLNIKKLKSPEAFKSWIYRIAVNTCMSSKQKKVKAREVSLEVVENSGHSETRKK